MVTLITNLSILEHYKINFNLKYENLENFNLFRARYNNKRREIELEFRRVDLAESTASLAGSTTSLPPRLSSAQLNTDTNSETCAAVKSKTDMKGKARCLNENWTEQSELNIFISDFSNSFHQD